jgi:hypothetical protein
MNHRELAELAERNEQKWLEEQPMWYQKLWKRRWNTWLMIRLIDLGILTVMSLHGFLCFLTWVGVMDCLAVKPPK